jgi:hypothetical protein
MADATITDRNTSWHMPLHGLCLVLLLCLCMMPGMVALAQKPAPPHPVVILAGFYTGEQYLNLPSSQREAYASGLLDGLMAAGWLGAKEKSVTQIHDCIPGLTSGQFMAIMDKFVREHPEHWSEHMSVILTEALSNVCTAAK